MAQTYTAYVKKYDDLTKAYHKNKGKRFPTAASYGKWNYEKYGAKENRSIDGKAPSGNVPGGSRGGSNQGEVIKSGRIASTDVYGATTGHTRGLFATPQGGYDWKVTGAFQDLPRRKGMFGSRRAVKRLPMQVGTTRGYAEVTNPNEKDRTKWEFTFRPSLSWKDRADHGEGVPDLMLGNLYKKKQDDTGGNRAGNQVNNQRHQPVLQTYGNQFAGEIDSLKSDLNDMMSIIQNLGSNYSAAGGEDWPGAPSWVKTYTDYMRWMRMRSKEKGWLSTMKTTTGLGDDDYSAGVNVTSLSA